MADPAYRAERQAESATIAERSNLSALNSNDRVTISEEAHALARNESAYDVDGNTDDTGPASNVPPVVGDTENFLPATSVTRNRLAATFEEIARLR